jgi:hypothetical protein
MRSRSGPEHRGACCASAAGGCALAVISLGRIAHWPSCWSRCERWQWGSARPWGAVQLRRCHGALHSGSRHGVGYLTIQCLRRTTPLPGHKRLQTMERWENHNRRNSYPLRNSWDKHCLGRLNTESTVCHSSWIYRGKQLHSAYIQDFYRKCGI